MKRIIPILMIAAMLLAGCAGDPSGEITAPSGESTEPVVYPDLTEKDTAEIPYESRFDSETAIVLSDTGITVNGGAETDAVYTSHDIVYYEEKTAYDSGYPYGEGTEADMHSADEAAAHTVVNITEPGAYRISGQLSAGQLRIDLGSNAYYDESAVVELILDNADITCTVAPAIVFKNVYECDGEWSADTAASEVDTSAAGAVLVLEGQNTVSGSYVAKIFKDAEGEKKLCKRDGAIYSYMSMNVYGPGSLDLTAENEGLDTELHLTINGGSIAIRSGNDGINTNEDGVSVTTINAGSLHIIAGLGEEGDGIDSNGWLVINGGTVVSSANPAADAGLDSDMGSYINGGVVVALGSTMDWAESDSEQVTMNLQFADYRSSGSAIVVTQDNGTVVFAYDPGADEILGENSRKFMGAVISCPDFVQGYGYHVYLGGSVSGEETGGVYDAATVTAYEGGAQMMYTGTDVRFSFGGITGQAPGVLPGSQRPEDGEGERPTLPEGETMPEGMTPGERGEGFGGGFPGGEMDENFTRPEGEMPEGFEGKGEPGEMPEDFTMPADWDGEIPEMPEGMAGAAETSGTSFYMADKVNAFSGVTEAAE